MLGSSCTSLAPTCPSYINATRMDEEAIAVFQRELQEKDIRERRSRSTSVSSHTNTSSHSSHAESMSGGCVYSNSQAQLNYNSSQNLHTLQASLGYSFQDTTLLEDALRHRSWVREMNSTAASNERLEFLGDAVLGWVVTDMLYHQYPELSEGQLSDIRKRVVNAEMLTDLACTINLGAHVMLNKGEVASGGRHKVSILADCFEAVLGAVCVDGGREAVCVLHVCLCVCVSLSP